MYTHVIRSSSTAVSIGRKPGTAPGSSLLLLLNRGGRVQSLRLSASLMQALHTPILSPSVARPIWNHRSLQRLHVSIHSACNILLNFLIRSQSTAETGSGIAVVGACRKGTCREGACRKEGGISGRGIGSRIGIRASPSKDTFRPSRVPLLLHKASSMVYNGGVGK